MCVIYNVCIKYISCRHGKFGGVKVLDVFPYGIHLPFCWTVSLHHCMVLTWNSRWHVVYCSCIGLLAIHETSDRLDIWQSLRFVCLPSEPTPIVRLRATWHLRPAHSLRIPLHTWHRQLGTDNNSRTQSLCYCVGNQWQRLSSLPPSGLAPGPI